MTLNRRDLLISGSGVAAAAASGVAALSPASAQALPVPTKWAREADVVVIGSGATGLPAAIVAREAGSSVILLEAEKHIGGHAITSGGNVPLGGGTSVQKKYGIEDSPGPVFPGPDRLVCGRTQRLSGLPIQRPGDYPRLRRQQRRDFRMAGCSRRCLRRQGTRRLRGELCRKLGAAGNA